MIHFFETEINLFVVLISSRYNMKPDFFQHSYFVFRVSACTCCLCVRLMASVCLSVCPSVLPAFGPGPRSLQWSPEWLITTSLPPRVTGGDRWAWIRSRTRPLAGPTKGSCCLLLQMRGGNDIINSSSDVNLQTRAKGETHEGKKGEERIILGSEREGN